MFRLLGSAAGQLRIFSSSDRIFKVLAFTIFRFSEFQGSRAGGFQGWRAPGSRGAGFQVPRLQGWRVPDFRVPCFYRFPTFQGSSVPGFQSSTVPKFPAPGFQIPGFKDLGAPEFEGSEVQSSSVWGFSRVAGLRVAEVQGSKVWGFQHSRVPEFKGSFQGFQGFKVRGFNQVPGFQNSKVPQFEGSRVPKFQALQAQGSRLQPSSSVPGFQVQCSDANIPNSVTTIGRGAFWDCSALELKKRWSLTLFAALKMRPLVAAEFQGSRVSRFQGSKVPGLQGSRVPRFQGSRVPGFQGFRVSGFQNKGSTLESPGFLRFQI